MNHYFNPYTIEVIVGTMSSGKTTALLDRGRKVKKYGSVPVVYYKPMIDTRDGDYIASRDGHKVEALLLEKSYDLEEMSGQEPSLILIDEAQFLDNKLPNIVRILKLDGHNVVCTGLPVDFRGQPFGPMPQLMALADNIHYRYPVCMEPVDVCHNNATLPQRLRNEEPDSAFSETIIIEGSTDEITYEPRCAVHHIVPNLRGWLVAEVL